MLPFLKNKQNSVAGLIIKNRPSDKPNDSEDLERSAEDCARDLIAAVQANDAAGVAQAIKDIANSKDKESEPKEDAPSPHTYDAQNAKAAQNKSE